MDYHFDEGVLEKQLQICPCAIITDKPINLDLLKRYRAHVAHLFYEVTKDDAPEFAQGARKMGLKIIPITRLSNEEVSDKKVNYFDVGKINFIDEPEKELIKKIKNTDNLFYKSNKIIMSDTKRFSSHPKYLKGAISNDRFEPLDSTGNFFDDLDHYHIVKLLD
jgi:chemotaxis response regulator CheB